MTSNYFNKTFYLDLDKLETVPYLVKMIEKSVKELNGSNYYCELDVNCDHNFGNYASGYRVFLKSKQTNVSLYVYTGLIYSYKKDPAGLFAEVDRNNNQEHFNQINKNIEDNSYYIISQKEDGFLKLFYTNYEEFIQLDYETQHKKLKEFIDKCFRSFLKPLNS